VKKKIIFLLYTPVNKSIYERFGFDIFFKNNWDVECWLMSKKFNNLLDEDLFYKKHKNFVRFKSFNECQRHINNLPNNFFFVDDWDRNILCNILQHKLVKKGGIKIVFNTNIPVEYNIRLKIFLNQKKTLSAATDLFFRFISLLYRKILYTVSLPKPKYLFCGGNLITKKIRDSFTEVVPSYQFDYQKYLDIKNQDKIKEYENSIIYIDQAYENNYDLELANIDHPTNEKFHWDTLNSFFDFLSKNTNKKVLSAAHPRRDKKIKINTAYTVIYGETEHLIKNAALVITHDSTAVNLAILFNKPLMFVTTNEIEKAKIFFFSIKKFAKELNTQETNVNKLDSINLENLFYFNKDAYRRWISLYIRSPETNIKDLWPDFIKFIESKIV
jgi:hypothetical protein